LKINKKKSDGTTVNSYLIRRPIQRWFPLFILPTFLCFCVGFIWPFIQGLYLSFCTFMTPRDAKFLGIENYIKAFQDVSFANAFWNTAGFAVVSIVLINVVAFAIAYALTQKMRGSNLFRTVFFMPNLIGGVVLGYIWSLIFDGILKAYSTYLTANATYGFWGLVILVAWQQIGYMMIIYIAGLQAVPEDTLEAAKIDGANGWQSLVKVIIPNVMPSITICTFLTLTNSFKLFDQNMALTGGAPSIIQDGVKINATELLALNIYSTYNIGKNWHGVAQAKAVIFFLLVAVLALAQQAATRSQGVQQQ
jgi:raffinose/stachyose/melibiose transport system permease protein